MGWHKLGTAARELAKQSAIRYTRAYRDVLVPDSSSRIFLAGHQPQLFHPGVWLKNFMLSRLAAEHDAVSINLLIDNDTVKSVALPVPGGTAAVPTMQAIPYDAQGPTVAYEERRVADLGVLTGFAGKALEHLRSFVPDPLLSEFWPRVVRGAAATGNLGLALAQARHQLEGDWGAAGLELPFSQVCEAEPFRWFAAHLLAHLPRLWHVYNDSLAEYRRAQRLRSASHPVPDLAEEDGWLEAPFWLWTRDDPRRRALFARHARDRVCLTDRAGCDVCFPLSADGDAAAAVEILRDLARRGIKLRTRALTTTLWARLALGDLFVHGIGGAKYDELTDVLIRRFFGLEPPRFMTISGTLYLPISRPSVNEDELRRLEHQLRELSFHPERFVPLEQIEPSERQRVAERIAAKRAWLEPAAAQHGRERWLAIRAINEEWVGISTKPYHSLMRQVFCKTRPFFAEGRV